MVRNRIALAVLSASFTAVACGGGGEAADAAMEEAAGGVQTEVAQAGPLDSCFLARGTVAEAQQRVSPKSAIELGDKGVLCYGAPSARDREVMGALVPYGEPWRMGADEATALFLTEGANVGGTAVEPGAYSLIAVPGADSWEIIVNSSAERWGIPINADVRSSDMFSFTVEPQSTSSMVEQLRYNYGGGTITMEWENTRVQIPFS